MRKLFMTLVVLAVGTIAFGQRLQTGEMQANAGLGFNSGNYSVPVYLGVEYGVYPDITVGGILGYATHTYKFANYSNTGTWLSFGVRGDYHFNTLLDIIDQWDLYAGLTLAYNNFSYKDNWNSGIDVDYNDSGVGLGLQIGGRYYFTDQWAINLEFGGGNIASGGRVGITYKF